MYISYIERVTAQYAAKGKRKHEKKLYHSGTHQDTESPDRS
jgi:hypothetical protein